MSDVWTEEEFQKYPRWITQEQTPEAVKNALDIYPYLDDPNVPDMFHTVAVLYAEYLVHLGQYYDWLSNARDRDDLEEACFYADLLYAQQSYARALYRKFKDYAVIYQKDFPYRKWAPPA